MNISSPLIDSAELAAAIAPSAGSGADSANAAPIVLDVRWRLGGSPGRNDYLAAHIPGARFIDLDTDLSAAPGDRGRHPLPEVETVQAALTAAGVSARRPVVVYDWGDGLPAARLWWTLRWAGHPDVRVLDGGFAAWERAGRPVESAVPRPEPGDFTVVPGQLPVLNVDVAAAYARRGALFDARSPERYRGETEPIDPVAGHIPGAGNLPYVDLVHSDGTLRSPEELRQRMSDAGVKGAGIKEAGATDTGDVGAYCGSGITAAHTVLAMTVAGIRSPALYVGSWSEWITDSARPIATAEAETATAEAETATAEGETA